LKVQKEKDELQVKYNKLITKHITVKQELQQFKEKDVIRKRKRLKKSEKGHKRSRTNV